MCLFVSPSLPACPSVCPHVTGREPRNRVSWSLILKSFTKICRYVVFLVAEVIGWGIPACETSTESRKFTGSVHRGRTSDSGERIAVITVHFLTCSVLCSSILRCGANLSPCASAHTFMSDIFSLEPTLTKQADAGLYRPRWSCDLSVCELLLRCATLRGAY
jgi:hypothetical protein